MTANFGHRKPLLVSLFVFYHTSNAVRLGASSDSGPRLISYGEHRMRLVIGRLPPHKLPAGSAMDFLGAIQT